MLLLDRVSLQSSAGIEPICFIDSKKTIAFLGLPVVPQRKNLMPSGIEIHYNR